MKKNSFGKSCGTYDVSFASKPVFVVFLLLLMFFCVSPVHSNVSMPGIFSDNMVLQRGIKIPIWGTAGPGEKITVTIDGKSSKTKAGKDGRWIVKLRKMKAGGPHKLSIEGTNAVTFSNVMFGDVWVCSGQSNMAMTINRVHKIEDDIANADFPEIRYFSVRSARSETPLADFTNEDHTWVSCSPETVGGFSAVAFFYARELHKELDVPIGLIKAAIGGTVLEAWMSKESLESEPELRPIIEYWDAVKESWPQKEKRYKETLAQWTKAQKEGKWVPDKPSPPRSPRDSASYSVLYNAMIAPVVPYGIKGVIWYQGESSTVRAHQHRTQFPAMIRGWREEWNQGDFPVLFVQLPGWETESWPIHGRALTWPEMRESQLMTLSVPNTGMAVTIDIGDGFNAHPNNKWDIGHRLALAALKKAYNRDIVYSGPMYDSMKKTGASIRLRFSYTANGLTTGKSGKLKGFSIAGENRIFIDADARIEGDEVLVSSDKVPNPVAVRYGWDDNPECTLYNSAGLPASPFRTDSWPGTTDGLVIPYDRKALYYWYPPSDMRHIIMDIGR